MLISERWKRLPAWAKWLILIVGVTTVLALEMAWGESPFFVAFAEFFVAILLRYGLMFGGLGAGYWVGCKVAKRTKRKWIGWIGGIAVCAVCWTLMFSALSLPGVGSRMKHIIDSAVTDYDYSD